MAKVNKKFDFKDLGQDALFRLLCDNFPNIVSVVGPSGEIMFVNRVLPGYEREEVVGKSIYDFTPANEQEKARQALRKVFSTGKGGVYDTRATGPFGSLSWYRNTIKPLEIGGEIVGVLVVTEDITRHKEEEAEQARLIQSIQDQEDFISTTSHQLRTPLASMKWTVELLKNEDIGKLNPEQKDFLNDLQTSIGRMIDLVSGLLNVSRIESGQLGVRSESIDVESLYKEVVKELRPAIEKRKHDLIFQKSGQVSTVKSDSKILFEILKNLISNAVKYTPENGKIETKIYLDKPNIVFAVKDNGIGIPKDQQSRIFQKFFRADNVLDYGSNDGTGLGLYVVKSAVNLLGGTIWFDSAEGQGTSFYFTIPAKGSKSKKGSKMLV